MEYATEIPVPLDYHLPSSNSWFERYHKVVDYLKAHGKVIKQSGSSPYNWRGSFCSYDEEDIYLTNSTGCKISLKKIVNYDSDARQGSLADARLIISGANKDCIDTLVEEINLLLKNY